MMYKIFLYFLLCCLFFSCANGNKQKIENNQSGVDAIHVDQPEEETNTQTAISEESTLDSFNPIGVLGVGLINIEPYVEDKNGETMNFDKIALYNDSVCNDLYCSYDIERAWAPPKEKNIIPIYNKIDYGWYCFVCTRLGVDFYEIAINGTDHKYVRRDKNITYYTWEGFFNAVFSVDSAEGNPFRQSPSDDAPIVTIFGDGSDSDDPEDYYQEIKLQGEWLLVRFKKSGKEGWLRWRRGNDVIVKIYISW